MDTEQIATQNQVEVPAASAEPSYLQESRVQSLLVNYTNWKWTKAEISNPDTNAVVYNIQYKMRKPHLRFSIGQDDSSPLGEATFHWTTTRIDIEVRGQAIELKLKKFLGSSYKFTSPTFQNQDMTWTSKSGWKSWDYVCLDEQQLPVAKITADAYMNNKICKVEFLGPVGDNETAKEVLLVTGLTLVYYTMSYSNSAAASSASAASNAAVAAAIS